MDDAEDADVIIHEYSHAISFSGSPNTNFGTERAGLDEGMGDYFATSYSRGISTYRWEEMFTWDGHNPFWPGRTATTPQQYPPSGINLYEYGEIWNAALNIAWGNMGQQAMDKVALQELFMNSGNMTLNDAGHLAIDADTMLYGGIHTNALQAAFCAKNIFSGQECIVGLADGMVEDWNWDLFPNPTNGTMNVHIPNPILKDNLNWQLTDLSGKYLHSGRITEEITTLSIPPSLPTGMYFLILESDNHRLTAKKVQLIR